MIFVTSLPEKQWLKFDNILLKDCGTAHCGDIHNMLK